MQGFRRNRARALAPTLAIAVTALLALAGPAVAHNDSHGSDDPAGTIASYDTDTGKLVIDLTDGDSIAGFVTRWTWIDAEDNRGCGGDGGGDTSKAKRHGRRTLHGDWCERKRTGDHHGHHGWRHGPDGDESDLVEGAVVDDAILVLRDGRAFFAKVDLDD
jgi:hypothetical protein